ncbi:MAG: cytochrome c family protein [Alphaproteobacteria bacterium]|nr:cytochrome c family protein [Alphaproteobacteria bacterium]
MDSFEWNKIFGAVLGTVLVIAGLNVVIGKWMAPHSSGKPGMAVEVVETPTNGGGTPVAEAKPDWGTVLPVADAAAGEKVAQKCLTCHDFSKGGPNKIGPNLHGILGSKHAQNASFPYSPAMKALAEKTWDYEEFNAFMVNPKAAVAGTKMAFAGLSKTNDRVNLIAYLRTMSDAPPPIPAPNPAAPPAAPAEGAAEPPAGEVQAPPPSTTPESEAPATPPAAAGTTPAPAPTTPPAH